MCCLGRGETVCETLTTARTGQSAGHRDFRKASHDAAPGTGLRNSGLGGVAGVLETRELDVPESALFAKRRCGENGQEVSGGDFGR